LARRVGKEIGMKLKLIGVAVGVLALAMWGPGAAAITVVPGTYAGDSSYTDYGTFGVYSDLDADGTNEVDPRPTVWWDSGKVKNLPQVDDLDISVLDIGRLDNVSLGASFSFGSTGLDELVGLIYDLEVTEVRLYDQDKTSPLTTITTSGTSEYTPTAPDTVDYLEVDLGNSSDWDADGYVGGRVDFWSEDALSAAWDDFPPATNKPTEWEEAGDADKDIEAGEKWYEGDNYDTFPDVSDGSPFLSGTLASGELPLTLTLYIQDVSAAAPAGYGVAETGYIEVLSNQTGLPFKDEYINGSLYHIKFSHHFNFYPDGKGALAGYEINGEPWEDPSDGSDDNWWATKSSDNPNFTLLPEPATLSLLGISLVGMGAVAVLRRRRKV
jgi:hypothetical protein